MQSSMSGEQETEEAPKRGAWMTELPENMKQAFGSGARTFKKQDNVITEADRRVWTESPLEAAKRKEVGCGFLMASRRKYEPASTPPHAHCSQSISDRSGRTSQAEETGGVSHCDECERS